MITISNGMKEGGVYIITVGVGYGIDEEELRSISTDPKYFFQAKSFDEILDIIPDIFALFDVIGKEPRVSKSKSATKESAVKNDTIIVNNAEFLKSTNSTLDSDVDCCAGKGSENSVPMMSPIIVNIQSIFFVEFSLS